MAVVSFEGRPKEAVEAERKLQESQPGYVPPEDRINVSVGRLAYKPGHGKQIVYRYSSFKPDKQVFDEYVDKCIQDAVQKGKIDFIYTTPNNLVFIGIS